VEEERRVEREPGHPHDAPERGERRDHPEARQHLQVLLVRVLELVRVGLRDAGADAEVVQDDVVDLVARLGCGELRGERFLRIDRHVNSKLVVVRLLTPPRF
jgi:hypothetical protein